MKRYKDFIEERCWSGYKPVPGKKPYTPGSCVKEEIDESYTGKGNHRPGWMLRADPKLAAKVKEKIDAAKLRQKYMGKTSDEIEKMRKEETKIEEDWQKVNKADRTDGLSQKAVNAYRRENPGSKLKTAVTEKNPTGKRAARRKSFCSRMGGMKKRLTNPENARDPDSPINKALRRWNC